MKKVYLAEVFVSLIGASVILTLVYLRQRHQDQARIEIASDGSFYQSGRKVSLDELTANLGGWALAHRSLTLCVAKDAPLSRIVAVVNVARDAQVLNGTIRTRPQR